MDILIQSLVGIAENAESPIHVRYLHMKGESVEHSGKAGDHLAAHPAMESSKKKSLIVIRRPYAFLQSAISAMFEGAEDVQVIVDRRLQERRSQSVSVPGDRRTQRSDRRASTPMLDVLININA